MPFILNFSHIYDEETIKYCKTLDFSDIAETNMFCSKQAYKQIKSRLANVSFMDLHFLDSGNYHYLTFFFLQKITYPFSLVLFDHHTDMQDAKIDGLLSCGNWVQVALKTLPNLKQVILVGPPIYEIADQRVLYLNESNLAKIRCIPTYISIDKDVLSPKYSITNWNQGEMSLKLLETLLKDIFIRQTVIGVDICGECDINLPFPKLLKDEQINANTNKELFDFIKKQLKIKKDSLITF